MAFRDIRDAIANKFRAWLGLDTAGQPPSQRPNERSNMGRRRNLKDALSIGKTPPAFAWNSRQWTTQEELTDDVTLLRSTESSSYLIVKKTMKLSHQRHDPDERPTEIRALAMLPDCNRILKPLYYERILDSSTPMGMAIFPLCPYGDVSQWKKKEFDTKMFKPVPESYIWRFFIQMAQALAFIHNELSPSRERLPLIHRDIKPKNILVVSNGSTYPSFKLHDFGLATFLTDRRHNEPSFCGTFEWQPWENPYINTKFADIWSLGACVHYLATGMPPIGDVAEFRAKRWRERNAHPASVSDYGSANRYYVARAPRVVTRIDEAFTIEGSEGRPPRQYSTALNDWMALCMSADTSQRPTAKQLVDTMIPEATTMLQTLGGSAALTDLKVKVGR